ncbi:RDD family protein [Aldersonia kunmingensis]|uniref:RDD family protein n=1 Tax=Aldersonia kunmingensis TaxID=408066 RepID=UPI0008324436|nr:RDD family protein [Aldersonia kunmingensis]
MPTPDHRAAGIVTRTIAAGIDVVTVLVGMGAMYLGWVLIKLLFSPQQFTFPDVAVIGSMGTFVMLSVIYLTGCWAVNGRTFGQIAMGLRVVGRRGQLLGWPRAFFRAVLYVTFGFGLFWSAIDRRRRSLQDIFLVTAVVYDWQADPNPQLGEIDRRSIRPQ